MIYQDGVHFRGVAVFVKGKGLIVWKPQGEARRTLTSLSGSEVIGHVRQNTIPPQEREKTLFSEIRYQLR